MDRNCNQTIFSGDADDWDTWKFLFEANAVSYGYDVILDGTEAVPKLSEVKRFEPDENDATELRKLQLYKLNSLAMVHLIRYMNSKTCEGKVATWVLKNTASDDFPTGNAFVGFQKLKERYASKSTKMMAAQLGRELHKRKQHPGEDPDSFISALELIRYKRDYMDGSNKISDEAFCIYVLEGLNKDYESFAQIYLCPANKNDKLPSIEELRKRLIDCSRVLVRPNKRSRH